MITVGSKEVKNRLGKYLRLVRSGETVEITDRGRPVARLLPASSAEERAHAEMIAALLGKGHVSIGNGRLFPRPKPAVVKPGKSAEEMIAEDRR